MYRLLTNIGITEDHNFREKRIIQILNITSLTFGGLLLPISFVHFWEGRHVNAYLLMGIGSLFFFNLLWNKMGFLTLSKIIVCFSTSLVPFFNIVISGQIPEGQYLSIIVSSLLFTVTSTILFDNREDKFMYYFSIAFYFVWLLIIDKIFYYLSSSKPDLEFIMTNYTFYKLPAVACFIAIVIMITIFKNIIQKYELENEAVKGELNSKNIELAASNQLLEERVAERTKKLLEINKKVIDLAFITSHKMRGPLTTIMGITNLLEKGKSVV